MSIANLQSLIEKKKQQTPAFLAESESEEKTELSKEITELFEALFKYLEASNKQVIDILKVISHDQRELMAQLQDLKKEKEDK
jgi:hypothetical protein